MEHRAALVQVVIPAWNHVQDTLDCLASLARQQYSPYHVTVVDNGSTDGTSTLVNATFPEVDVLRHDANLGYVRGSNAGIRRALERGADFVFLLNNDTLIDPLALQHLVEAASGKPNVGAASPAIYWCSEPERIWYAGGNINLATGETSHSFYNQYSIPCSQPFPTQWANGCAMLVARQAIEKVGPLDEALFASYEDVDFSLRLWRAGYQVIVVPPAKVWHKVSTTWGRHTTFFYYTTRNRLYLLQKLGRGRSYLYWTVRIAGGSVARAIANCARGRRDPSLAQLYQLLGVLSFIRREQGEAPGWIVRSQRRLNLGQ